MSDKSVLEHINELVEEEREPAGRAAAGRGERPHA